MGIVLSCGLKKVPGVESFQYARSQLKERTEFYLKRKYVLQTDKNGSEMVPWFIDTDDWRTERCCNVHRVLLVGMGLCL